MCRLEKLSILVSMVKLQLELDKFFHMKLEKKHSKILVERTKDLLRKIFITLDNVDNLTKKDVENLNKEFELMKKEL